jgi:uroporphyrinogen-III synthase
MVKVIAVAGLKNKIIAITRNEINGKEFLDLVSKLGGRPIALPTIEIVSKGSLAAAELILTLRKKKHDYCAFMSPQAVSTLFNLAGSQAASVLKSTTVIAVGPKTKDSLQEHDVNVKLMPRKFSSIGLVEMLSKMEVSGKKIIIPRSSAAGEFIAEALTELGMEVDEVFLYEARTSPITGAWNEFSKLLLQKRIDAVIFTSASNVKSFFEIMGKMSAANIRLDNFTKVVSIGPFTSKELRKRKIRCFEADEHTVRGTIELANQIA